ncbi:g4322 [Coccomyxa elongata]
MDVYRILFFKCLIAGIVISSAQQGSGERTALYAQKWSAMPSETFPGGTYKYSNIANFPGSPAISASLVTLVPGGLRELHWHNASEWAYVLNGTCRSTVIESTGDAAQRPTETWDFATGDLWYFRPNEAHMVQGLAPTGCTYLAGYNDGAFDDKRALSASAWLSTLPPEILAQGLGTNASVVDANVAANTFTFMPLGPVPNTTIDEYRASFARLPSQDVVLTHRYQLANAAPAADNSGGWLRKAGTRQFPIATDISGAVFKIAPGGMRQIHWHTTLTEWQFIINGTVRVGVFTEPGVHEESILGPGDVGYAPKGAGHWLANTSKTEPAYIILIFDGGPFTDIDLPWMLGNVPYQVTATTLNTTVAFPEAVNYVENADIMVVTGTQLERAA